MDRHLVQGIAAMTVSQFLEYCLQSGMVGEILAKRYAIGDADQIKEAIQEIANEHAKTANYHRDMERAIKPKRNTKA
jgi:hypothetical protein